MRTETYVTYFIVRAKATLTREDRYGTQKEGDEIDVVLGNVRGMTDNGQPGYLTNGGPEAFKTAEEARHTAKFCGNGWNFKDVRDEKVIRVTKKVITEVEEVEIGKDDQEVVAQSWEDPGSVTESVAEAIDKAIAEGRDPYLAGIEARNNK